MNVSVSDNQASTQRNIRKYRTENKPELSSGCKTEETDDIEIPNGLQEPLGSNQEVKKGTASKMQTYFNMFKCFIGIGILATPAAVQKVGIFGGAFGIIVCGIIGMYTMKLQILCKQKVGNHITSYSELGYAVFGPNGKAFVDFNMVVSQFGFCIAYLIFIGN